jgi:predicted tellurium resistance membrane protein TerC
VEERCVIDRLVELLTIENLIALLTLSSLEIVLGIDNIVLIAILSGKLEKREQARARRLGLLAAMVMRIVLLLAIGVIMRLTKELFQVLGHAVTGKDLVLLAGGLFLIAKATYEIHHKLEEPAARDVRAKTVATVRAVVVQIMLLDIVFSLDSVITAVGMAREIPVMIAAVVIAVGVMLVFAGPVSRFIEQHPTIKMLALSFMLLIGVVLVADGAGKHIERGYIYFAMAFSLVVELLNLRMRRVLGSSTGAPTQTGR